MNIIKELRKRHPEANIVAIDYDPGASEVNQLNRIKLMLSTAQKNLDKAAETKPQQEDLSESTLQQASINTKKHFHKRRSKGRRKDNTKNKSA